MCHRSTLVCLLQWRTCLQIFIPAVDNFPSNAVINVDRINYCNERHVGWPITRKICIISLLMDRQRSGQTDRRTDKWDIFIHSSPSLTPSSNLLLTLSTINHEVRLSTIRQQLANKTTQPGRYGRNDDCVKSLANRKSFARVINVVIEMCICPRSIRL